MFDITKFGTAEDATAFVGLLAEGMAVIAKITSNATVADAANVLTIIKVVVGALTKAYEGKVSAEAVRDEWKACLSSIAANDAHADDALATKFKL